MQCDIARLVQATFQKTKASTVNTRTPACRFFYVTLLIRQDTAVTISQNKYVRKTTRGFRFLHGGGVQFIGHFQSRGH